MTLKEYRKIHELEVKNKYVVESTLKRQVKVKLLSIEGEESYPMDKVEELESLNKLLFLLDS